MYRIEFTPEAIEDLKWFKKNERRFLVTEIEDQLVHEPGVETRNRKRLRPNKIAEWELRVDKYRIFYDIDETQRILFVVAAGLKIGNALFIHGERYVL